MGIYSTLRVSRETALKNLKRFIENENISNDQLSDILFACFADRTLNNYSVVNDQTDDQSGEDFEASLYFLY